MKFSPSAEQRICHLLARPALAPADQQELLSLAASRPNWLHVSDLLISQHVYPQAHRNLDGMDIPGLPDDVRQEIARHYQMNAVLNELQAAELSRILRLLHDSGLQVIPLKGLPLATELYGDASLRVCSDMDLLVPARSVLAAYDLLCSLGYQAELPRWAINRRMMANTIQMQLQRTVGAMTFVVELHWSLFQAGSLEEHTVAQVWRSAERKAFRGTPMMAMAADWQLLYLLVHAARHNWQGLKWLVDIDAACARVPESEFASIMVKATQAGWERLAQWSLAVCRLLFGTALAGNPPLKLPYRTEKICDHLLVPQSRWNYLTVLLRAESRFSARVRTLLRLLFSPTGVDYACWDLPPWMSFAYYPLRPLRLARSAIRRRLPAPKSEAT